MRDCGNVVVVVVVVVAGAGLAGVEKPTRDRVPTSSGLGSSGRVGENAVAAAAAAAAGRRREAEDLPDSHSSSLYCGLIISL